jgi:uncharacterized protein involved in type VI secretion and phage assembly
MNDKPGRYYGKYRGTVLNNIDPKRLGRIQAQVPDVLGPLPCSWATPCVPVAGIQTGVFVVPAIGSGVWIEFEQGDLDHPIWTGGWWSNPAEVPVLANLPAPTPNIVLKTAINSVLLSDNPSPAGGILLQSGSATIIVNDTGIIIQNGKGASIILQGSSVIVNAGALTVL